jgi:microcystin-dependent protein
MAGSISLSMSQQFDDLGKPLSGGLLYFIEAGTTSTPQNAYQDSALTIAHPNPITLDSAGRVPQFYLADGSIKIRLTDSAGVQQLVADNVLVVGPSSGSGGGGSVDATTVLATGDIKVKYGTGTLSGFVRANGRTIGSASSGATERANADAQALFEYLWGADANLTVSSGRGASANADWTANKTIALPDFRGRVLAGMDDMGNTAAGRLTSAGAVTGTTLGYAGGEQLHTMTAAELVQHNHSATTTNSSSTFPLAFSPSYWGVVDTTSKSACALDAGGVNVQRWVNTNAPNATIPAGNLNLSTSVNNAGSSTPFNVVQPTIVVTMYIKL